MTHNEFNDIVENRISKIRSVLSSKANEYSTSEDRLHNFHIGANLLNTSSSRVCFYYATKHLTSILDMVNSEVLPTREMLNEKIGDMINYLILLEATFLEKIEISEEFEDKINRTDSAFCNNVIML